LVAGKRFDQMKSVWKETITFAAFLMCLVFSGSVAVASDATRVRMACNEFPPHKMQNSPDGLAGFDVEMLQEAFSRTNIEIEIEFLPWKRALVDVQAGRLDGLCSCSQHADRDQWLDYSDPLGSVGIGYFYLGDK
jgi:polar amino acid transport system substrate-binding protein